MDISLGKLQQLLTVARTGSFSKAAEELHLSQPALSRSIATLERRYGFQIFNRLGHGVQPTAAGAQVIAEAAPLLQSMRIFENNLKLYGIGQAGALAIGLSPLLASDLLARFASEFFKPNTKAELRAMVRSGPDLLVALHDDAIELFFFPESHIDPSIDIETEAVGSILPSCVVRAGHPLAGRDGLRLADLADFPWASSVDPPAPVRLHAPVLFFCDNYHILREAVANSNLICICSSQFVAGELAAGTLVEIEVDGLPLPPTMIFAAKLRGRASSPLAVAAVKRMRGYLNPG